MDLLTGEEQKIEHRAQVGDRIDTQRPFRVLRGWAGVGPRV